MYGLLVAAGADTGFKDAVHALFHGGAALGADDLVMGGIQRNAVLNADMVTGGFCHIPAGETDAIRKDTGNLLIYEGVAILAPDVVIQMTIGNIFPVVAGVVAGRLGCTSYITTDALAISEDTRSGFGDNFTAVCALYGVVEFVNRNIFPVIASVVAGGLRGARLVAASEANTIREDAGDSPGVLAALCADHIMHGCTIGLVSKPIRVITGRFCGFCASADAGAAFPDTGRGFCLNTFANGAIDSVGSIAVVLIAVQITFVWVGASC